MAYSDVDVQITEESSSVSEQGFGMPLILSTAGDHEYTEYSEISEVESDFDTSSETYKQAEAYFYQDEPPERIAIYGIEYNPDADTEPDEPTELTSALNELIERDDDWYFLLSVEQGDEEIKELSSWIDNHDKLYFAVTDSQELPTEIENENAIVFYHSEPSTYPDAAWIGECAGRNPGSQTWKFKNLNGIEPVDLSLTEIRDLHDNYANTYLRVKGNNQTSNGQTADGSYIDIKRAIHWLKARMGEAVQEVLVSNDKVAFDNDGISLIESTVRSILKQAVSDDYRIIARDNDGNGLFTLSAPNRSDINESDLEDRLLPDIEWEATIAGAVHNVEIRGVLSY
ncbi:hypothetical protein J2S78_002059 [Salibacterium salarium]|uniref:DUF3383 family protein n=1 Tax=Salibacterium salarium TaxID=284579 RepID=UPI0027876BBC|nr:DUF3383 family protein [Salibacterium salarium]MDQ0299639.1 hypothetical protein [Salibacterium salarium]